MPSKTEKKLGNRRVTGKEQFYTPASVAETILERVLKTTGFDISLPFLEPAAGTGAFMNAAQKLGFERIIGIDIEPKHPNATRGDFLSTNIDLMGALSVTNPPFGRNNSLSIPFFNRAAHYCDVIAFIVPRSWRKWTVINRLNSSFELVDDWDLTIDYVDQFGLETHGVGNLRTCVQVWKRLENGSRLKVQVKDNGFIQKVSPKDADVAFSLFGYACGKVETEFERVPNSTKTYFKLLRDDALEALQSMDFSRFFSHTAYTEALSISEINYLLNEWAGLKDFEYSSNPSEPNYLGLQYGKEGLF